MGGSYKQCLDCGKRALSIATRCPGCGRELLSQPVQKDRPARGRGPARFLSPRLALGGLAAAGVVTVAWIGRASPAQEGQSSTVAAASVPASSEVAYATTPPTPGELLVARTWTSVRKSRSKGADLEAVLLPGDTVLADSLERGWYRVALEGEVLGYVHHSTLAELGAPHP